MHDFFLAQLLAPNKEEDKKKTPKKINEILIIVSLLSSARLYAVFEAKHFFDLLLLIY